MAVAEGHLEGRAGNMAGAALKSPREKGRETHTLAKVPVPPSDTARFETAFTYGFLRELRLHPAKATLLIQFCGLGFWPKTQLLGHDSCVQPSVHLAL